MAVIARKKGNGYEKEFQVNASTTVNANRFGALNASGLLIEAVPGTAELKLLILETKTVGASGVVTCRCLVLNDTIELEMDTAGNTSQALVGTKVDLTDAATVNQAASSTKVIYVTGLVGPATARKITGVVVSKDA